MTQTARDIISNFDRLPPNEQKEITKIILQRNLEVETPTLSNEELILNAEEIFLELDRCEAEENAKS